MLCVRRRYELLHAVRTHMGASDPSYSCVFQQEDEEGTTGAPCLWLPGAPLPRKQ